MTYDTLPQTRPPSHPILLTPFAHAVEDGHEGLAALGKSVLHFRRDLRVFRADNQFVGFELFQRKAQRLEGDALDVPLQHVEPHDPEFHERVENGHFVFAADERQRVAESRLTKFFVADAAFV